ncbi:Calx-beta domain-containing protein, partial [Microbacterium hydrocarbonoxydans]
MRTQLSRHRASFTAIATIAALLLSPLVAAMPAAPAAAIASVAAAATPEWAASVRSELASLSESVAAAVASADEMSAAADDLCGVRWVGPESGGRWDNAANWAPHVPTDADDVCILAEDVTIGAKTIVSVKSLNADAEIIVAGDLGLEARSSIEALTLTSETEAWAEPRLWLTEDTMLSVVKLKVVRASASALGHGLLHVTDEFDVVSADFIVEPGLSVASTAVTDVDGEGGLLQIRALSILHGQWWAREGTRIEVVGPVGFLEGSVLEGAGEVVVADKGRLIQDGTLEVGALLVETGGEAVIDPQGDATVTPGEIRVQGGALSTTASISPARMRLGAGTFSPGADVHVTESIAWAEARVAAPGVTVHTPELVAFGTGGVLESGAVIAGSIRVPDDFVTNLTIAADASVDAESLASAVGSTFSVLGEGWFTLNGTLNAERSSVEIASRFNLTEESYLSFGPASTLRLEGAGTIGGALSMGEGSAMEIVGQVESTPRSTMSMAGDLKVRKGAHLSAHGWLSSTALVVEGELSMHDEAAVIPQSARVTGWLHLMDESRLAAVQVSVGDTAALTIEKSATVDVSGDASGLVEIDAGGALEGSGTVEGSVRNNGTLRPGGDSFGVLTVHGDLQLSGASTLQAQFGAEAEDRITVGGTASLGGTVEVIADDDIELPRAVALVSAGAIRGEFAPLDGCRELERDGSTMVLYLMLCASIADAEAAEDAGHVEVPIELSSPSGTEVVVSWMTEDGTARAGDDYVTSSGEVRFAKGETQQSVRVPILDDERKQGDVAFTVQLSAGGDVRVDRESATVTIRENEKMPEWVTRLILNDTTSQTRISHMDETHVYARAGDLTYQVSLADGRRVALDGVARVADALPDGGLIGYCWDEAHVEQPCFSDTGDLWQSMPAPTGGRVELVGIDPEGRVFARFVPRGAAGGDDPLSATTLMWEDVEAEPATFDAPGAIAAMNDRGDMILTRVNGSTGTSWYRTADGTLTELPGTGDPALPRIEATALSSDGKVVGWSSGSTPGISDEAWLWTPDEGGISLGRGTLRPTSVNASGVVVGDSWNDTALIHRGWIWRDGVRQNLSEVGDGPDIGIGEYTGAVWITDTGIIGAAIGAIPFDNHAHVALYPVGAAPEPAKLQFEGHLDEASATGADEPVLVTDDTVEGNTVRLVANVANNDEKRSVKDLKVRFWVDGEVVSETDSFELEPGDRIEHHARWETEGLAWEDGVPAGKHEVTIELVDGDGVRDTLEGEVTVNPRPVIAVPGFLSSDGAWQEFTDRLQSANEGWHVEITAQDVATENPDVVVANAATLATTIQEVRALTNAQRVDLVAHSTGGIAAREYLARGMEHGDGREVERLLMLGTPNAGAACADLFLDPIHLPYRSDIMSLFNLATSETGGVAVSGAAGTAETATCDVEEPGDGFSVAGSALWNVRDAATYDLRLEELVGDAEVTEDFVLARLSGQAGEAGLFDWVGDLFDGAGRALGFVAPPERPAPQVLALRTATLAPGEKRTWATAVPADIAAAGVTISAPAEVSAQFRFDRAGGEVYDVPQGSGAVSDQTVRVAGPAVGNWAVDFTNSSAERVTVTYAVWVTGAATRVIADLDAVDLFGTASVTARIDGPGARPSTLNASVTTADGASREVTLRDDGTRGDANAGDGTFSVSLEGLAQGAAGVYVSGRVAGVIRGSTAATLLSGGEDNPGNDAPTARDLIVDTVYATPVRLQMIGADPEADDLTYTITEPSEHGTIDDGTTPQRMFTPDRDFVGETTLRYTVSDGQTESAPATITVRVAKAPVEVSTIEPLGQGARDNIRFSLSGPAGSIAPDPAVRVESTWQGDRDAAKIDGARFARPVDLGTDLAAGTYPFIVHFPGDAFHEAGDVRATVRITANAAPRILALYAGAGAEAGRGTRLDLRAFDAEEGIVRYDLDVDGDGEWDISHDRSVEPAVGSGTRAQSFVHEFATEGATVVRARVTDRFGVTAERELHVQVTPKGPDGPHQPIRNPEGDILAIDHGVGDWNYTDQALPAIGDSGRYLVTGARSSTDANGGQRVTLTVSDTVTGTQRTYEAAVQNSQSAVGLSSNAPLGVIGSTLLHLETGATTDLGAHVIDLRRSTVSDDGNRVVTWDQATRQVILRDLASGEVRELEITGELAPLISADGSTVMRAGARPGTITVLNVATSESRVVEVFGPRARVVDVSDDGRFALVRAIGDLGSALGDTDGINDAYRIDTRTGERIEVTTKLDPGAAGTALGGQAALSGDGSTVVVWGRSSGAAPGLYRVLVEDETMVRIDVTRTGAPGTTLRRTDEGCLTGDIDHCPHLTAWPEQPILDVSPDGRSVLFGTFLNDLFPGDVHATVDGPVGSSATDLAHSLNYIRWTMPDNPG